LLAETQPSVRYSALINLLGYNEHDSEVKESYSLITRAGWVKDILDRQLPSGLWDNERSLFNPTFHSTFWMLLILSDFGVTKENRQVDKASQQWMERNATGDGGFSQSGKSGGHLCITGNSARALVKLGYTDHPKVRKAFDWFVKNQAEQGGWSCWNFGKPPYKGRTLDSWEPLSAFAVYPRQKWTRSMKSACEKGAEFFLERELHKQGARWDPWYRFHYPVHYYYDILVGLDFMTALGYTDDKRMGYAISLLKKKRRPDGKWNLDANRPEQSATLTSWRKNHPKSKDLNPFVIEQQGQPSKMITLTAMKVLARLGEAP
jgi:hypothetical protein